jgi:ubiquinone/menaquinone biosynthesis C-methylase UbiE
MKDHYVNIYSNQAPTYHEMMLFEDVDQNLTPALENITLFQEKQILDLGTGTGRLPLLFPNTDMTCLDLHWGMLIENKTQRDKLKGQWKLLNGNILHIPFNKNQFDLITCGWALGHFAGWYGELWQEKIGGVLEEMHRVVKPKGTIIIIETLTTGSHTPAPPTEALATYYNWLEEKWGFVRQEVQTDFLFNSLDDAIRLAKFFFGDELADKVKSNNWVRLPEWTGIWSKTLNA